MQIAVVRIILCKVINQILFTEKQWTSEPIANIRLTITKRQPLGFVFTVLINMRLSSVSFNL